MNHASPETEPINLWKKRDELPTLPIGHKVLSALICFFCALGIPLCLHGGFPPAVASVIAPTMLIVLVTYVALMARAPLPILLVLFTAVMVMSFGTGFSVAFSMGAITLALIVGIASGSLLMTAARTPWLAVISPVAAAVAAYFLTNNIGLSLLALFFLPAVVLMSLATLWGKNRTTVICYAMGGLLLFLVVLLAVLIYRKCGSLSRDAILTFIESIKSDFTAMLIGIRDEQLEFMKEITAGQLPDMYQQWTDSYSDSFLAETTAQLFQLVPAIAVVLCSIVAFEAQLFLGASYRTVGFGKVTEGAHHVFTMSVTASVIYTVAFILMLFVPTSSIVALVAQNITLILIPGLCVVSIQSLVLFFTKIPGASMVIPVLLIAALACCATGNLLYLFAMWGAYAIISGALRQKMQGRLQNNDQDDRGDF